MSRHRSGIARHATLDVEEFAAARVGTMVGVDAQGRPLVRFPGGPAWPVVSRLAVSAPPPGVAELQAGISVVLIFEDGDEQRPIIVGLVRERFDSPAPPPAPDSGRTEQLALNGPAVIVEGRDEIVLRCGLGSLTIRANGQIVIKGTRLVSRASETNKIRGAAVHIN
jgi:hypothetical protein